MTDPSAPGNGPARFPPFAVTVDIVVFALRDGRFEILLIERARAPYQGCWALPGGFKEPDETLEAAALRELAEETNATPESGVTQFGAYGDPGRDPRTNVVTIAFVALLRDVASIRAGDDARHAALHAVADVLSGRLSMAFDHRRIVTDAVEFLRRDVAASDRLTPRVRSRFARAELVGAFEALDRALAGLASP